MNADRFEAILQRLRLPSMSASELLAEDGLTDDERAALERVVDASEDTPPECPQCGGPGVLLGTLGSTVHLRCRNCGWEFMA